MLSDEQLTQRLRVALAQQTAHLDPPPGLLEAIHTRLADAPPARAPGRWMPRIAGAVGLALAAAIAIGVVVLAGHGAHRPPVPATQTATTPGTTAPRTPARPAAGDVSLALGPVGVYCDDAAGRLAACRAGQRPVTTAAERLVTITLRAPRATATGRWYAWSFTPPPGCGQSSAGGHTLGSVRPGTQLSFQALLGPGCRGVAKASVVYVMAASRSDSERFTPVGHASVTVP